MHVLRYIKATLHYKITYGGERFKDLKPVGWVDADYGGDVDSQRSCGGYVFVQAGRLSEVRSLTLPDPGPDRTDRQVRGSGPEIAGPDLC